MRTRLALVTAAGLAALLVLPTPARAEGERIRAVSLDPADYLAEEPDASRLATALVERLAASGVNLVYVNAYNVQYGAYYRTAYRYTAESEYGRQDLLGKLIAAAHHRNIRVIAALYDHQHRGAWEARPDWRAQTSSGAYYNPPGVDIQYYLSTGHPGAVAWWRGFLRDLVERYPDLDGVEIREPIVNWWGAEADYNPAVTQAFRERYPDAPLGGDAWRRFRQATLTRFLRGEIALIQDAGLEAHVTSVADVDANGALLPAEAQAVETGFDLDALVGGSPRPDAVKVELIWQQWAALYGYVAFTPEWTRAAARDFLRQVRGRAPVVVHVELTDFGRHTVTPEEFHRTLVAADRPEAAGIDFYSAALADEKGVWPVLTDVYRLGTGQPRPAESRDVRALVLYDRDRRVDHTLREQARLQATQLANLLGHFAVSWELRPVDGYRRGDLDAYDTVFYLGSAYGNAPQAFVSDVSVFPGTAVWIGQNLFELAESGVRLPFAQVSQELVTGFDGLSYGGLELPANGETILTAARPGATVRAWLTRASARAPFVLESQGFWYVTGSPFSFLAGDDDQLNGRYLVFSDLLHEMLGQAHSDERLAFLRIEDVTPLASAERIRGLADALGDRGVPFLVGVIPFFVDPVRDETVALSDRPEVAEAIRYAVSRGGAVVLHGSTHQYHGRTALDAEFWDLANGGGVTEDGDAYVRSRLERALEELWANGIHPLAWETPHYLATPYDYALFAAYFSTFVERRTYGVLAGAAQQQSFPYLIEREAYGGRIVPENLGYLRQTDRDPGAMLANADALRAVRDGVAGGFLHLATPPDVAAGIVDSLGGLGYGFLDLYELANVVGTAERIEISGEGTLTLAVPSGWSVEERVVSRGGTLLRSSRDEMESYARVTRRYAPVPAGGVASLRLVPPDEAPASPGTPADPAPAPAEPVAAPAEAEADEPGGRGLSLTIVALAGAGALLLLAAYAGVRARTLPWWRQQ